VNGAALPGSVLPAGRGDGGQAGVRPALPADRAALLEMVGRCSG
jgi:hypothetical protein